jgi:enoyl-CoA hydratase/carnithine racemase
MTAARDRPHVLTAVDGDLWRLTLDSPDTGNAVTPALAAELAAALTARPEETRAVLVLANGPRFCVGGDVRSFAGAADPGAFVGQLAHDWHAVIRALLHCPVPVVAGVHGAVAGAGIGLIGACDVVVCARTTKLRPGYGGLMLTNGVLTAVEAHLTGLVARLVEDEDLHATAVSLAREIAAGPIRAMARTRALVRRAANRTLDEQLDDEAQLIADSAADPEGVEGVRAFVEKRAPDFRTAR